jgi:NADP-dependent aldehyde dehydrogenase
MQLHGKQIIGGQVSAAGPSFRAVNPATSAQLDPPVHEATAGEADRALRLAEEAFADFRAREPRERAALLEGVAKEIEALGEPLIERAHAETALPVQRLQGERARTANQLRMFARLILEGSWVDARIDPAMPERKPLPRPDLRRMLVPLGPVVSFSASNFPLAISVAGNDLSSAFAAGCPIVVKGHPAHPGTAEMVAGAVARAVAATRIHPGIFSHLQGRGHEIGLALVRHPLTRAVAFTGSLRGGRALFDAANARPEPIPVFAEMGSTNPVFVLPGAMAERGQKIAEGLKNSVVLGVGQFCTNPGLVLGIEGDATRRFAEQVGALLADAPAGTMLYGGIRDAYESGVERFGKVPGVKVASRSKTRPEREKTQGGPALLATDVDTFLKNHVLREELFGPATMLVTGRSKDELMRVARTMDGQLTATIHGTEQDLAEHRELIDVLRQKVGRLIFNGYPTGIEPCAAVHHSGPYPATTDARTTSIGTAAIERWVRPVCYQDFPQSALPPELRDENPRNIWRLVDGQRTKEKVPHS